MTTCTCDNCGYTCNLDTLEVELTETKNLNLRLNPGSVVPAGECPHCGCLTYLNPTTFTVLLQRPDYIADNYGEDNFMWQGEAADSIDALEFARAAAIIADGGEEVCDEPTDYRCLILLAGIHDDLNPELGQ
jgi:hypothetical protein